ncbi:hypothetical protein RvY_16896 [Ramazzottius varieornatus]|uniref:Uncharacterized protein n=1 Tax=Ramazzottius varieornatus TaxID=947166 RepID=A0A1D1W152_RAMVA|nr:hypothetical protein RvY_16896 [Ramazzottius varieornatus]
MAEMWLLLHRHPFYADYKLFPVCLICTAVELQVNTRPRSNTKRDWCAGKAALPKCYDAMKLVTTLVTK